MFVCLVIYFPQAVTGYSTTLGKTFVIALPGMENMSICCLLTTLTTLVEVNVNSHRYQNRTVYSLQDVYVARFQGSYFEIESHNINRTGVDVAIIFQGNGTFALTILATLLHGEVLLDALTALPVEGWGRIYYVVTAEYQPTLHVVTLQDNNLIKFIFKYQRPELFENVPMLSPRLNMADFNVIIDHWQTFTLSSCNTQSQRVKSLSGTVIEGEFNIGVITGTCQAAPERNDTRSTSPQVALEMLMPSGTYGRDFIAVGMDAVHSGGRLQVMSFDDHTTIEYHIGDNRNRSFYLTESLSVLYLSYSGACRLYSDKAVQVVYMRETLCPREKVNISESLCVVVPVELFYDVYTWRLPQSNHSSKHNRMENYLALVVLESRLNILTLNDVTIGGTPSPSYTLLSNTSVSGKEGWLVIQLRLHLLEYNIFDKDLIRFGCYLYGRKDNSSYHTHVGYVSSNINTVCVKSTPTPGDLIDNDCDKKVDEEPKDGRDNDEDTYIDEDLVKNLRVNGGWGKWSAWTCTRVCSSLYMFRTRKCDSPPPRYDGLNCGTDNTQNKTSDCYVNSRCPSLCPQGTWAVNCVMSCRHCLPDCDKFTGACSTCSAGFRSPLESCSAECDPYSYGVNCSGSCLERCDGDCYDRVTGACNDGSWDWMNYMLVLPLILFAWMIMWSSRIFCGKIQDTSRHVMDNYDDTSSFMSALENTPQPALTSDNDPLFGETRHALQGSSYRRDTALSGASRGKKTGSTSIDSGTRRPSSEEKLTPPGILVKKSAVFDGQVVECRPKKSVSFASAEQAAEKQVAENSPAET